MMEDFDKENLNTNEEGGKKPEDEYDEDEQGGQYCQTQWLLDLDLRKLIEISEFIINKYELNSQLVVRKFMEKNGRHEHKVGEYN